MSKQVATIQNEALLPGVPQGYLLGPLIFIRGDSEH